MKEVCTRLNTWIYPYLVNGRLSKGGAEEDQGSEVFFLLGFSYTFPLKFSLNNKEINVNKYLKALEYVLKN